MPIVAEQGYEPSLMEVWLLYVLAFACLVALDCVVSSMVYCCSSAARGLHQRLPHQWRVRSARVILFGKCRVRPTRHQYSHHHPNGRSLSSDYNYNHHYSSVTNNDNSSIPRDSPSLPVRRLGSYNNLRVIASNSSISSTRSASPSGYTYNGNGVIGSDDSDGDDGPHHSSHNYNYYSVDHRERDREAPTPTSLSATSSPLLPPLPSPADSMDDLITTSVLIAPSSPSESRRLYRLSDAGHNSSGGNTNSGNSGIGNNPGDDMELGLGSVRIGPRSPSMSSHHHIPIQSAASQSKSSASTWCDSNQRWRMLYWSGWVLAAVITLFYPYIMLLTMLALLWMRIIATAAVQSETSTPPLVVSGDVISSHHGMVAPPSLPLTSNRSELSVYQQTILVMYLLLIIVKAPSLLLSGELSLRVQWDLTLAANRDGLLVWPMMWHLYVSSHPSLYHTCIIRIFF
jgi:hypothetical protein